MKTTDFDNIGTGIKFPFQFSNGGTALSRPKVLADITDEDNRTVLKNSMMVIFGTQEGETFFSRDDGCDLLPYVFDENSKDKVDEIRGITKDAVSRQETRLELVDTQSQRGNGEAFISTTYQQKMFVDIQNDVVPVKRGS